MSQRQDSEAVRVTNEDGRGPVVLVCEHASNHVPEHYHRLGLTDDALMSHIAWDPGALIIAERLRDGFDAPLVAGRVSRLVYDCNRPPEAESAMPERSEKYEIPGNAGLSPDQRIDRVGDVYIPFRSTLEEVLDLRAAQRQPTALVTIHSFTPLFHGKRRDVEIGILHDTDRRLADLMLEEAERALPNRDIRRNAPYGPEDGVTHTLKLHGLSRGLLNVMIELRSDLLHDATDCETIANEVTLLLRAALDRVALAHGGEGLDD